jgi:AAA family ATP:ADP antiporter
MRLSRLERLLRLFTDVRAGEGATALLMFANVFLILCAYYFIKPLREGWIAISDISGLSKMEVKAYTSFGQSLALIPVIALYARLSTRLSRRTLITAASLFFLSNLVIFWALQPGVFFEYLPASGIAFYLWVGMFSVFVVAQFWTFAADIYTDEKGRRLLPMIAIGATAGAAAGSGIAERLVAFGIVPTEHLLLAATLPLGISIAISRYVDSHSGSQGAGRAAEKTGKKKASAEKKVPKGALGTVLRHPFLLVTAALTLLFSWVNTNGENLLFSVVQEFLTKAAPGGADETAVLEFTRAGTTAFYSNFYFWVNGIALLLQAFVCSRLLRFGGFGAILLMLPVISLLSYSAMALVPVLAVVKLMKIAENSVDYSIHNTARHVLWLPVSSELKFKGKPAIDTFMVRIGDGFAALTVLVGERLLHFTTQGFAAFNVMLVIGWLGLALMLVHQHGQLAREAPADAAAA